MANECLKAVVEELEAAGVSYEIDHNARHVHVHWGPDRRLQVVAKTASDYRAAKNERASIRRQLRDAGYLSEDAEPDVCAAIVSLSAGKPVVKSIEIAEHFEKQHKNVLAAIDTVRQQCGDEFNRLNFKPIEYLDTKGRRYRAFEMTRDGFSLVAMGFTGEKATAWKVKYIAAFNAMEAELRALASSNDIEAVRRDVDAMFDMIADQQKEANNAKRSPVIPFSVVQRRIKRRANRRERLAKW